MTLWCYSLPLRPQFAMANWKELAGDVMKTRLQIFASALISMAWLKPVAADETNETIYFLVEAPGRVVGTYVFNDSYVLPLSKQEDIDHARFLISLGRSVFSEAHQALVGAKVGPGKDGINRNYLDP